MGQKGDQRQPGVLVLESFSQSLRILMVWGVVCQ